MSKYLFNFLQFSVAIHTLINSDEEPIVVFKNGLVLPLSNALENRKALPECDLVDKMTSIEDQTIIKVEDRYFVGLFLKNEVEYSYLWISVDTLTSRRIDLKRMGLKLNGHLAMLAETGPTLFTLCKYFLKNTYAIYLVLNSFANQNFY